jgi:hypothetical protein
MTAIRNSGLSKLLAAALAWGSPVVVAMAPFVAAAAPSAAATRGGGSSAQLSRDRIRRASGHQQRLKRRNEPRGASSGTGSQAPARSTPARSR